jgi:hypothetical protein
MYFYLLRLYFVTHADINTGNTQMHVTFLPFQHFPSLVGWKDKGGVRGGINNSDVHRGPLVIHKSDVGLV